MAACAVLWIASERGISAGSAARAAAVVACMAIWWLTEALPIHWTACLPLLAFPLLLFLFLGAQIFARSASLVGGAQLSLVPDEDRILTVGKGRPLLIR